MTQIEPTKTARITILGTPQFKDFLKKEAQKEGISVSQLVRQRCEMKAQAKDEAFLAALIAQVRESTQKAKASLELGLADAATTLADLRGQK